MEEHIAIILYFRKIDFSTYECFFRKFKKKILVSEK